jgi:hypothetical protein
MTQPFDPNAMNEEEVRIRRMLAYKSLVLSILQRSFIFLLFIAVVVAALVLILLYRQGQKNFFRYRGSANLIYSPSRAKTYEHPPLSIANVYQIISTPIVKKNAGELAQITADKDGYLGRALEASLDRKADNTLTLTVTWDDEEELAKLLKAYMDAASKEYDKHRKNELTERQKQLAKNRQQAENEKNDTEEKINKLIQSYPSSLEQELDKLQKRAARLEEEQAGYIQQKVRLKKQLELEKIKSQGKELNPQKQALIKANYKYFMDLIKQRDEALLNRNKQLERYSPDHPDARLAEKELEGRQSLLEKVLGDIAEEDVLTMDSNSLDVQAQIETVQQLIDAAQAQQKELQEKITEIRDLNQKVTKLKDQRANKSSQIEDLDKKKADIDMLIQQSKSDLQPFIPPSGSYQINGLQTKQYLVALFAGGLVASFMAIIIILVAAQFGCISTATELHDMAEIEVFSLSESQLKKLEPAALQEAAHNVFYVLNQIIEDRRYLFFGALQGSYSTALLLEQLLLQFAMNGTRIFILNLEPFATNSDTEGNKDDAESASEDPISEELLGVEKNGDTGVFRLGNISFISPNEQDILKMDMDTLLKHYDKIIFRRKNPFTGKELLFKQVITLTQCCIFSVGKKRSPRSFLKLLRDNKTTEETIITGIFTEP